MTGAEGTVFVVDDDPSVRGGLARLFKSVGLAAEAFASAREFLGRAPIEGPACLVLDVRLPELSGLDLQEELARAGVAIPIIFITGHGTVPTSVRAMKAGAADFLEKPVDEQELLDAVRRALEQDRRARQEQTEAAERRRRLESLTPREREVLSVRNRRLAQQTNRRRAGYERKDRQGSPGARNGKDEGRVAGRPRPGGRKARPLPSRGLNPRLVEFPESPTRIGPKSNCAPLRTILS